MLLSKKLIVKIPDSHNAKKHYQSFLRKKNRKWAKQSEIITYQTKTVKNPNIVNINLVIIEHPKTLHKLSKTTRKDEKVGCNSSFIVIQKWNFFERKKCQNNNENMLLKAIQVFIMLKF